MAKKKISIVKKILHYSKTKDEDIVVALPSQESRSIKKLRFSQYTSVAYALRAIFAVQQDALLFDDQGRYLALDPAAIRGLEWSLKYFPSRKKPIDFGLGILGRIVLRGKKQKSKSQTIKIFSFHLRGFDNTL